MTDELEQLRRELGETQARLRHFVQEAADARKDRAHLETLISDVAEHIRQGSHDDAKNRLNKHLGQTPPADGEGLLTGNVDTHLTQFWNIKLTTPDSQDWGPAGTCTLAKVRHARHNGRRYIAVTLSSTTANGVTFRSRWDTSTTTRGYDRFGDVEGPLNSLPEPQLRQLLNHCGITPLTTDQETRP